MYSYVFLHCITYRVFDDFRSSTLLNLHCMFQWTHPQLNSLLRPKMCWNVANNPRQISRSVRKIGKQSEIVGTTSVFSFTEYKNANLIESFQLLFTYHQKRTTSTSKPLEPCPFLTGFSFREVFQVRSWKRRKTLWKGTKKGREKLESRNSSTFRALGELLLFNIFSYSSSPVVWFFLCFYASHQL